MRHFLDEELPGLPVFKDAGRVQSRDTAGVPQEKDHALRDALRRQQWSAQEQDQDKRPLESVHQ
jgi:hypothetical protein